MTRTYIVLTLAADVPLARKVVVLLLEQTGSCEHRHHEAPESCHIRFLDLLRRYFQLLCYAHSLCVVLYEHLSPPGSTVKHWVVQTVIHFQFLDKVGLSY